MTRPSSPRRNRLGRGRSGLDPAYVESALAVLSAVAQPAGWDDVIAAARKEVEVVVCSAYISPLTHSAIADAFLKKYGVRVSSYTARGVERRGQEGLRGELSVGACPRAKKENRA